ncbi:fimbrial protein [Alcaligenes faecalis]|uniref:fimbrial protein n=1 Tax=Alcaligenes faecalis TaxID=511 RepID=UPI00203A5F20|nr:fimbrial protein [Alcaligenes faecalis]MCM2559605.1 fimbrial protein [Alcaligenes faecalis]MCM2622369.1 fimbrial protein [Alcaligenes faecalis]
MTRRINKNMENMVSILCWVFLVVLSSEAKAQGPDKCLQNPASPPYYWKVIPSGNEFYDGQVIATASVNASFYYDASEPTAYLEGGGRGVPYNRFDAIPMPQTPGVGVRITWAEHWVHGAYSFQLNQQKPKGTRLSGPYWFNLLSGSAPGWFTMIYYFDYEIVVIDASKYKGGKPIFTQEANVTATAYSNHKNGGLRECINGTFNLLAPLVKDTAVPELPKPPVPTCASATLNVVATLPPVTVAQVAPYGSNRSQGVTGEYRFDLVGRQCPLGTKISAYFTDTRAPAADNNYVKSSHPSVGVCLYHRDSADPIKLGPAPVGSTMPSRLAVVEGPSTSAMSDMHMPMTAQYVAMPEVDLTSITPGSLQAEAVVTFMYD